MPIYGYPTLDIDFFCRRTSVKSKVELAGKKRKIGKLRSKRAGPAFKQSSVVRSSHTTDHNSFGADEHKACTVSVRYEFFRLRKLVSEDPCVDPATSDVVSVCCLYASPVKSYISPLIAEQWLTCEHAGRKTGSSVCCDHNQRMLRGGICTFMNPALRGHKDRRPT